MIKIQNFSNLISTNLSEIYFTEAVQLRFPNAGENDYFKPMKNWLAQAQHRIESSAKLKSGVSGVPAQPNEPEGANEAGAAEN